MAETLVARKGKASAVLPARLTTLTLGDGSVVAARDFLSFKGEAGRFRFHHADAACSEVTVWGPCLNGMKDSDGQAAPWNTASWRTFRVDVVSTVSSVAAAVEKVTAVAAANGEADYASMTPGQKAAFTKRMRALAAVAA